MSDYLVRAISEDGDLRGLACVTTNLVDGAKNRFGTYPTATAALGRALTGGALMGALLKTGERVALKFEGNGPLRKIVVEAESNGSVRGYVAAPEVDLPLKFGKLDVASAVGRAGLLTVAKDLRMKEPYHGVVELYTSEIAEDLAYYLTASEQVLSAVGLGVFVDPAGSVSAAGGFLVQTLPSSNQDAAEHLIANIEKISSVSDLIHKGISPQELLQRIFSGISIRILEERKLAFRCNCSKERVERALFALGRDEIGELAASEENTEITCEFCQHKYVFGREELERLISTIH